MAAMDQATPIPRKTFTALLPVTLPMDASAYWSWVAATLLANVSVEEKEKGSDTQYFKVGCGALEASAVYSRIQSPPSGNPGTRRGFCCSLKPRFCGQDDGIKASEAKGLVLAVLLTRGSWSSS